MTSHDIEAFSVVTYLPDLTSQVADWLAEAEPAASPTEIVGRVREAESLVLEWTTEVLDMLPTTGRSGYSTEELLTIIRWCCKLAVYHCWTGHVHPLKLAFQKEGRSGRCILFVTELVAQYVEYLHEQSPNGTYWYIEPLSPKVHATRYIDGSVAGCDDSPTVVRGACEDIARLMRERWERENGEGCVR